MERQLLENLAAETDERTTMVDYRWWDAVRGNEARLDDEYTESGRWVPIKMAVCPLCNGSGEVVNPSIDAHGLTREDFDEDPDFEESYFRGDYNQPCGLCHGEKVIPVPLDASVVATIEEHVRERWEDRSVEMAEARVGA